MYEILFFMSITQILENETWFLNLIWIFNYIEFDPIPSYILIKYNVSYKYILIKVSLYNLFISIW